jgi:hypothetical protein
VNDRETFDRVKAHLLKQDRKSFGDNPDVCAYRGSGGLRCAVGCLIPDDRYDPRMEGVGLGVLDPISAMHHDQGLLPRADAIAKALVDSGCRASVGLLIRLQQVHDRFEPKDWADELDKVERDFAL